VFACGLHEKSSGLVRRDLTCSFNFSIVLCLMIIGYYEYTDHIALYNEL